MFGPTEAKLFEAFFWFAAVALFVQPLFPSATPLNGWQDQAVWLANSALAAAAGLFFTLRRIRPDKHPQKLNIAIVVLLVFLMGLHLSRC